MDYISKILGSESFKSLAGVVPEVNLREHVTCIPLPSAKKASHSGFEIKRSPNRGISGTPKRTYVLQKFKNKTKTNTTEQKS